MTIPQEGYPGALWDRCGERWQVFDVDATRQAARQRAVPRTADLPAVSRRLDEVCAPGYLGQHRGEVVRTRTTLLQIHTHQWMGTFGEKGNGDYRGELLQTAEVIVSYQTHLQFPLDHALVRLDRLYGNGAIVKDLDAVGRRYVMRGKD